MFTAKMEKQTSQKKQFLWPLSKRQKTGADENVKKKELL